MLRYEGVLEFGRTPSCGSMSPDKFLRNIIAESGLAYSDTLMALLDYAEKRISSSREESNISQDESALFISDDPAETPPEKFDRGVMLLSLLSQEDIHEYGHGKISGMDTFGCFSTFFSAPGARTVPYFMLGSDRLKDLFGCFRIKNSEDENTTSVRDSLVRVLDTYYGGGVSGPIALEGVLYHNALLHCANSGVSCSGWLYNADNIDTALSAGVDRWIIEHFDERMADLIMHHEGYYLLAHEGEEDFNDDRFLALRKYVVGMHSPKMCL